jgi:eukaryotic-like serine/threonine-protein kinase
MTPERWQRIRGVYEEVSCLALSERSSFLDRTCADDSELRREVESLLGYEDRVESIFLKMPAADLIGAAVAEAPVPCRIGRRIGVYEIAEEIGHGGMGEVYRAARVDGQYEKQVAVKLVRGGYDSRLILERFRHERQILATLDHPNIARLIDGGTTEEGTPYLVMELIEGLPIDQYCEEHNLSLNERLHLFEYVCSAVQYAHQRLVIHRDIKPSNILVTVEGVPKLLDFGIAKILDPSAGLETTLVRPMTPEYASPEQIRGDPITTASDVYSLGVLLYRLLTGRSPYRVDTRNATEHARAVSEIEPERPSVVISRPTMLGANGQTPRPIGGSPHSAKMRRLLKGDLDNIVLKCLRKEPDRRYVSADKLQEDIYRHLQGLPVLAAPDSLLYRTRKFIQRNKVGVTAAALVLLAIVGAVSVSLRQAQIAEQQRRRAEKRFEDIRKLANSLIFEIHDSIEALPGATPSRKLLLDRAVEYLDNLSQDASGDLNLQRELAWAYERLATVQGDTTQSNLGQVSAAEESHRKAMALFEAVAKANPHSVTDQLNVAMAYRMRAFFDIYVPSGGAEIERALAVTEPLMLTNGDNLDVKNERAEEYFVLASIQDGAGDRLKAVDRYRRVLRLRQEIAAAKPDYPQIRRKLARASVLLGAQIARFGSREEGISVINEGITEYEALAKLTKELGVTRELATSLSRRADAELMSGDFPAAIADFQRAKEFIVRPARLDPENQMLQSDLWVAEFEIGRALAVSGKSAEALPVLIRALDGYQALHLEDDVGPGPGAMQAWIGEAQAGTHQFAEALTSYERAVTILAKDESNFDDARCDAAMVQTKIGNMFVRLGNLKEAKIEYIKALEKSRLTFSLEHMDTPSLYAAAEAYAGMGDVAAARARQTSEKGRRDQLLQEARTAYHKSLDVWKHIPGPARYGPNDYLARDPAEVAQRLAECEGREVQ